MADNDADVQAPPLGQAYIDAIKQFEGFSPKASWDYSQWSNGYGTKASHPGEVIDQNTAEQRLNTEVGKAASAVDRFSPNIPEGPRAALTSLTYNAGPGWMRSGLGRAVQNGDWDTAQRLMLQYNRAGGQVLPGLTSRRQAETSWFNNPPQQQQAPPATAPPVGAAVAGGTPPAAPAGLLGAAQTGQGGAGLLNNAVDSELQKRLAAIPGLLSQMNQAPQPMQFNLPMSPARQQFLQQQQQNKMSSMLAPQILQNMLGPQGVG